MIEIWGFFGLPIDKILIIAGLIFLFIAAAGRITGKINPGRQGRIASGICGFVLLALGLAMYLLKNDGEESSKRFDIRISAHVQGIGWMDWVPGDTTAGTTGQGRRLEAIKIELVNAPSGVHVIYQAHVEGIGWQSEISDGGIAGTEGQSKRMEAIRIRLVNAPAGVHVIYQAHVEGIDWQNETSDWGIAGTEGQSKRMEAIRAHITGP